MKTLIEIQDTLKGQSSELARLHVASISLFGSVVRGEAKDSSDIDVLVEFTEPVGMFEFLDLKYFLEAILGAKVDLATKNALHPRLKDAILREAVRVA